MGKNGKPDDGTESDDEHNERISNISVKQNEHKTDKTKNNKKYKNQNKVDQALDLPTVMNVNPRSIYNKLEEFHDFVIEHNVDCIFMSESWERPDQPLDTVISLPDHTVISNPHQRKGAGGRPALIINNNKFHVRNITQSLIEVPWGVEATWAMMTPKNISNNSIIKNTAVCSLYSKPNSKKKELLLDHINQAFNVISTKFKSGLHFILAGDTNDLKLGNIINLTSNMKQLVSGVTRLNPPAMLDPVMSTLGRFYQQPVCLPPLNPDPDSCGRPSDHFIVLMKPINALNNKSSRTHREIKVRPLPASGLKKFEHWIQNEDWADIMDEELVDKKAEILQNIILTKLDEFCPEKVRKISSDDQPFFTQELKRLHRRKRREFTKNRRSNKFLELKKKFKKKVEEEKKNFKKRMIDDVMTARDSQWYSKLKRITNYNQIKSDPVQVEEISHLSDKEQAEAIADSFSTVSNEYGSIQRDKIIIPPFSHS